MGMQHHAELILSIKGESNDNTKTIENAFAGNRIKTVGSFNGEIQRLTNGKYIVTYIDFPYYEGDEIEGYCKLLAKAIPNCSFLLEGILQNEGSGGDYGDEVWASYSNGVLKYKFFTGYEKKINKNRPDLSRETRIAESQSSSSEQKDLTYNDGVVIIENSVLKRYNGLNADVVIPEGVKTIGDSAFSFKGSVESVIVPEGVVAIKDFAFVGCSNLKRITLPSTLESIGVRSFAGCSNLSEITLPKSLKRIGVSAFIGCSSFTALSVPVEAQVDDCAFKGCDGLSDENGMVIVQSCLFDYSKNDKNVSIPEGVTEISTMAFKCRFSLVENVILPKSLTSIHKEAFLDCTCLKSITLSKDQIPLVRRSAFPGLKFSIVVHDNDTVSFLAYSSNAKTDNFSAFVLSNNWDSYDLDLISNGPHFKYSQPQKLLGALGRLIDPVDLDKSNQEKYIELINKNAKKYVALSKELQCPEMVSFLLSSGILDEKNVKALRKLLSQ